MRYLGGHNASSKLTVIIVISLSIWTKMSPSKISWHATDHNLAIHHLKSMFTKVHSKASPFFHFSQPNLMAAMDKTTARSHPTRHNAQPSVPGCGVSGFQATGWSSRYRLPQKKEHDFESKNQEMKKKTCLYIYICIYTYIQTYIYIYIVWIKHNPVVSPLPVVDHEDPRHVFGAVWHHARAVHDKPPVQPIDLPHP